MRGLKSFGLLLVVAIGLGAYVYFVDMKKPAGEEAAKKDKVFTVEADKIDEITVKAEAGDKTTLKKNGDAWQIVQPMTTEPDPSAVTGLTSNLAALEVQRVIDENPADLKVFGLADPRVVVSFRSGGKEERLDIGQKTPTGSDLYAKLGDQKKVFLISSFLDSSFNRTTFDLRDKTVLKLDQQKVDALEVTRGDATLKVVKKDSEWQIEQPIAARADFGAIEGLISRIATAQMKSIAAPDATDLKKYGLDKPAATVKIGTGSAQATLALGSPAAEGTVYAKDLSRPAIFTLESSILDELKKDAGDYRQKDLFDARSFTATRIDVTRNGQTVAFEKTKVKDKDGNEQDTWKQVLPSAKDVDSAKVEALVSVATNARAMGFVTASTKTNLDKPELTIAIKYDGKEERVTFARNGADGFAERTGSPGAATVETVTIDSILKALDEIK
ncbi:MAG TPA: DUF4340 domain-containing protein [Vicinamibacterales bacterium]